MITQGSVRDGGERVAQEGREEVSNRDSARQVFYEMVDESTGSRREILCAWVISTQICTGQRKLRKYFPKAAAGQILCHVPLGSDDYALPRQCPVHDDVTVVTGKGTMYLDGVGSAIHYEAPDTESIVVLAMNNAAMTG